MTPAFWRFLPDEVEPDVAAIQAARAAGKGFLSRGLRDARDRLGAQRMAVLLRRAAGDDRIARRLTLLAVCPFQPRAIEDALSVAFAIAGLRVEIRAVDGFAAAAAALDDPGAKVLKDVDMAFMPMLDPSGDSVSEMATLASALADRCAAPVLIAGIGAAELHVAHPHVEAITMPFAGPAIDARFGRTFGAIPTAEAADRLADTAAGFAAGLSGAAPKLIVTDLDGTLWHGTLGEDGVDALGFHRTYGEALKELAARGLVLGIASRNDLRDVEAAFAAHPAWPVSRGDFAALAIGWDSKDALAAEVLRTLNLGPEHMLFVDDDPVNCAKVAERFPQADVRMFRGDAGDFAAMLLADPLLRQSGPTGAERGERYRRRDAVERLRAETLDIGDFLRRLQTKLTVVPLGRPILARAAELASRVNQFALNGYRPTAAELAARGSPFDFMIRLDDVFGEHGLVGLVLAHAADDAVVLDSFFLSCRAFGRGVEDAMLWALGTLASARGCDRLVGTIEHLPRNEPARKCFSRYLDAERAGTWTIPADDGHAAPEGVTILWERTTI